MPRLHSDRLRSYPGRPVQLAVGVSAAPCVATCREFGQESAEVIVGVGSYHEGAVVTGNELGE
ncbi:MAG: hypothetical protein WA610_14250 [Thermodesulfovibrionales bacterium]